MGISKAPTFLSEAVGEHVNKIHRELQTHTELLTALTSANVYEEEQHFEWIRNVGIADATGQVQIVLLNRTGFSYELVSWSAVAGAASNGGIVWYLNSAEPQNVIWSAPQTQYNSDKFTRGMIVPPNANVIAQFLNCGSGQQCFANVLGTYAQVRKTKPYGPSPVQGW